MSSVQLVCKRVFSNSGISVALGSPRIEEGTMTMDRKALLAGVGMGAGLMYFFDPIRGRRRRAAVRDRAVHSAVLSRNAAGATARDLMHRTSGTAAEVANAVRRRPVDEDTLTERVRSRIGRIVSHPHAITVEADNGVITLGGPILQAEVPRLLREVERVDGVREIVNQLEEHKQAGDVPGLQGGSSPMPPRPDIWQRQWAPATRVIVGAAGSAVAAYGVSRRDLAGALLTAGSVALVLRAATNLESRRLTGIGAGRRAVDIQKTITIGAPVEDVFAFWVNYRRYLRRRSL